MPKLTQTHAVMIMQDAGSIMTAAKHLQAAIEKKDDETETARRKHIESCAYSILHLVNDLLVKEVANVGGNEQ